MQIRPSQQCSSRRVEQRGCLRPEHDTPSTSKATASAGHSRSTKSVQTSTLATARYLCSDGTNLRHLPQVIRRGLMLQALNSATYAQNVLGWVATYATGVTWWICCQSPSRCRYLATHTSNVRMDSALDCR